MIKDLTDALAEIDRLRQRTDLLEKKIAEQRKEVNELHSVYVKIRKGEAEAWKRYRAAEEEFKKEDVLTTRYLLYWCAYYDIMRIMGLV